LRTRLEDLIEGQAFEEIQLAVTGDLGPFVQTFNRFAENARRRLQEAEAKQAGFIASSKVLAYQKTRIESILEMLPDATLVLDDTGVVTFATAKLESILGVSKEQAIGRKPVE